MTGRTVKTDRRQTTKKLTIDRKTLKDLEPRKDDGEAARGGLSFIPAISRKGLRKGLSFVAGSMTTQG
jgi:hypothetical protein